MSEPPEPTDDDAIRPPSPGGEPDDEPPPTTEPDPAAQGQPGLGSDIPTRPPHDPDATTAEEDTRPEAGGWGPPGEGSRLGRYVLGRRIARGGMSDVYLGRDPRLGRPVAVKVLRPGPASEDAIRRFQVDARAMGRLEHDGVVPIFDAGEDRGYHFLVMPYYPDGSLADLLKQERPLPDRRLAALMARVARAVQLIHEHGILHRDLKPSNVLLEGDRPRVADFGLAKILEDQPELTLAPALMGTLPYMPPEQTRDAAKVGPAADVYGLGATLYRALVGRPPFHATHQVETLRQVREDEPQRPRALDRTISRDLETVCLKCLEKDPRRRFATAARLAEELERVARGEPIATRPISRAERLLRWSIRRPLVASLLALSLALAVVSFAALTSLWWRAERDRRRLEREDYFSRVALASAALAANQADRAQALLAGCPEPRRDWEWRVLWRLRHEEPTTLDEPTASLSALAFRPDSSALAVVGRPGHVQVWDPVNGRRGEALPGPAGGLGVQDVAWLAPRGGREAIAVAMQEGAVRLWRQGEVGWTAPAPGRAHEGNANCLAAHPGSGRFVSGGDDGRVAHWGSDSAHPAAVADFRMGVLAVAISPDGQTYAATGRDRQVWLGRFGEPKARRLGRLDSSGTALAFHPDGRRLASGEGNGTVVLWDVETGRALRRLVGHFDRVAALAFHPDGHRLASGGEDGHVRLWDPADGREVAALRAPEPRPVEDVAFSPDGRFLAACDDDAATLWDSAPRPDPPPPSFSELRGHADTIIALAVAPGGDRLASADNEGRVLLWDVAEARSTILVDPGNQDTQKVNAVAFRGDGLQLASGGRDKVIRIWDATASRLVDGLKGHEDWIGALAYSPDGSSLASGDTKGHVLVWDLKAGGPPLELGRQPDEVYALAFHPGGRLVATAGADRAVWLWDRDGGPPARLEGHTDNVEDLAFSPDGRLLASAGSDRTVILWDVATRTIHRRLAAHVGRVWGVAFSPDGRRLATAGGDSVVRIWDVATGRRLRELRGHTDQVCAVAFDPGPAGRRFLASGGGDRTVRLWDASAWQDPP